MKKISPTPQIIIYILGICRLILKNKVLIVGGTGLFGINWAVNQRNLSDVVLCLHQRNIQLSGIQVKKLDLESVDAIQESLLQLKPNLVVNAAGFTRVEDCELFPEKAFYLNAKLPYMLGVATKNLNIPLVHLSTDHIFAGNASFAKENDSPDPQNIYGMSKLQGENLLLDINPAAMVVRTNFYGWGTSYRKSFSDFVYDNLSAGRPIDLYTDIFYTPILISQLIDLIIKLVNAKFYGVINLVGDDRVSKYQFACSLAEVFNLNADLIRPCLYGNQLNQVNRPFDMSLSNELVKSVLGPANLGLNSGLNILLEEQLAGLAYELESIPPV